MSENNQTNKNQSNHNQPEQNQSAQNQPNQPKKSSKRLIFILPLIIFIGLVVMLFFRLGQPTQVEVKTATNRAVPSFSLPNLAFTSDTNAQKTLSNADLPTSPYLLNVWGSWCPTCLVEHPFLMELSKQGVDIVGVNYKDEAKYANEYLQEHGNPFSLTVVDEDGDLALDLGLTGAPETFVVDGKGIIRQHIVGEVHQENWKNRIQPCMQVLEKTDISDEQIADVCK